MKKLINNLGSIYDDILDTLLMFIIKTVVGIGNVRQHLKMKYFLMRGIPGFMVNNGKFGEKKCVRFKGETTLEDLIELEFLRWFWNNCDFGPADDDVR